MPSEPAIDVRGVSKRFGEQTALDVSLSVQRGEVLAMLGPNGCGKSTLLRTLAGVVIPDRGAVTVCGRDVLADRQEASRHTGVMLEGDSSWYTRLTGRANLEFFSALRGLGRKRALRAAAEQLDAVGLQIEADRPVGGYSAGMRACLALARARLEAPRSSCSTSPALDWTAGRRPRRGAVSDTETPYARCSSPPTTTSTRRWRWRPRRRPRSRSDQARPGRTAVRSRPARRAADRVRALRITAAFVRRD